MHAHAAVYEIAYSQLFGNTSEICENNLHTCIIIGSADHNWTYIHTHIFGIFILKYI